MGAGCMGWHGHPQVHCNKMAIVWPTFALCGSFRPFSLWDEMSWRGTRYPALLHRLTGTGRALLLTPRAVECVAVQMRLTVLQGPDQQCFV